MMGVYTMKCVAYENPFQIGTCEKFRTWVPPPPEDKSNKVEGKRSTRSKPGPKAEERTLNKSTSSGRKRKRVESGEDEDEVHADDYQDSGSAEETETMPNKLIYSHRGTRSGPLYL